MSFGSAWGAMWAGGSGGYGWANWNRQLGRTRYDYASQTDPSTNAIVTACILWICRTFPEAPLQILQDQPDDTQEPVKRHPLSELLKRPNQYYSGILLWYATLTDWLTRGNAYWVKVRSGSGRVVELWWVPEHMMQPRWPSDGSAFLSYYEYRPDGLNVVRVEVEDVVHFRYGMDPDNVRKGLSPLASLMREVFTDDEAANFTSSILKNLGVPGVVLAPDDDGVSVGVDDLEHIKAEFMARFGGDRRGEPLVMSGKTKVTVLSFSPQQMDLKALRRIPEERISAIFGTPAIVVGLGAGLDRSTFANYAEAREAAYESNIIPTQALIAAELDIQLLPDFADPLTTQVGFDLSKVRVLQADQNELHARAREDLLAGLLTRNAALLMIGEEAEGPDGEVLYIPNTITATDPTTLLDVPEPLPPPATLPPMANGTLPAPAATSSSPGGKVPAALAAGQRAKQYAELDLKDALAEHLLVLAESSNGHSAT
jgi:HK97 family phage portal protein